MRSCLRTALVLAVLAAVTCLALPAVAEEAPQTVSCDNVPAVPAGATLIVYSEDGANLYGAEEVQISVPECNCTLPGTAIPPGQLGLACASPIGGPPKHCRNVLCYTLISTPWINGVCR